MWIDRKHKVLIEPKDGKYYIFFASEGKWRRIDNHNKIEADYNANLNWGSPLPEGYQLEKITESEGYGLVIDWSCDENDVDECGYIDKDADLHKYREAFWIACQLLNGCVLYGYDADRVFEKIIDEYDICDAIYWQKFILTHLDRFCDDDERKKKAIEELGW